MKRTPSSKVLSRYFSSKSSAREIRRVEAWRNADPENKHLFENLKKVWEISGSVGEEWDYSRALAKLRAAVKNSPVSSEKKATLEVYRIPPRSRSDSLSLKVGFSIAAVMIALVGTFYLVRYLKENALTRQSMERDRSFVIQQASTKPGQQVSLRFADGTEIVLNSASSVKYSTNPRGVRNVFLQGEAYFKVIHSKLHPFIVHVDGGTIKDVGTQFDVQAWPGDNDVRVAVIKGLVSVLPKGRTGGVALLKANEFSLIGKKGVVTPPTYVSNVSKYVAWMEGKYSFHNDPMAEVVRQIWRTYGIHCFVSDTSILSRKITTSFSSRDPAKRVIDIIALSLHLHYKLSNDSVLFIPSGSILSGKN